jgi:mono/diheme cytochrome c family protein
LVARVRALRAAGDRPSAGDRRYVPAGMAIAVILLWLLVGLGVFFVAMHRGPRGARQSLHTESKAGQRLVTLGVVVLFAFGLAVPALVLAFNGEHKASVAVGGLRLSAEQQKGRELFARSCAVCHTLAAVKGVGKVGPNLDVRVGDDIATPAGRKALVLSAIAEGRARGLGQMPAQLYQGKEAEAVAGFVAAVAGH